MLYRTDIELRTDFAINLNMSSLFQGAMLEQVKEHGHEDYGERLHQSELHPYTQHLELRNGVWHWVLTFLDDESHGIMWNDSLSGLGSIELRDKEQVIPFGEIREESMSLRDLNEVFNTSGDAWGIALSFVTPACFKSNGRYVFMPELSFILQSAMRKYDAVMEGEQLYDHDTLEDLCGAAVIQNFSLRSQFLSLEGVRIPGFSGWMTVRCPRSRTMTAFLAMLMTFAGFSGIGIKTGMGMGAVRTEICPRKEARG